MRAGLGPCRSKHRSKTVVVPCSKRCRTLMTVKAYSPLTKVQFDGKYLPVLRSGGLGWRFDGIFGIFHECRNYLHITCQKHVIRQHIQGRFNTFI